jgi:Mrp family chromosome partitioning ATPase
MKLLRTSNKRSNYIDPEQMLLSLELQNEDGATLMTIPGEVVESLRRSISRLILKKVLPARLALVATLRQEGTSYLARAFATTMANDLDANVCAVELNWWWPDKSWPVSTNNLGLAGVLTEQIQLKDAIIRTNRPNLSVLPAGRLTVSERPVFARSTLLKEILYQLNEQYEYLILDIPAILATNDASPLATLGDACCMVVQQGVTPVEKVRQALDEIDQLQVLGVILNKMQTSTPPALLHLLSGVILQDSVLEV